MGGISSLAAGATINKKTAADGKGKSEIVKNLFGTQPHSTHIQEKIPA